MAIEGTPPPPPPPPPSMAPPTPVPQPGGMEETVPVPVDDMDEETERDEVANDELAEPGGVSTGRPAKSSLFSPPPPAHDARPPHRTRELEVAVRDEGRGWK